MANECIVVNSSAVIALAEANLLNILATLYKEIIVPRAVYEEVVVKGQKLLWRWVKVVWVLLRRLDFLLPMWGCAQKDL